MAASIQRVQIGEDSFPVVIVASQDQAGNFWIRVENYVGASQVQMSKAALLALAAAITQVANS